MESGNLDKLKKLRDVRENLSIASNSSSYKVVIDEEKMIITITTPQHNAIVIDDKAQTIEIKDEHKNKIELSKQGIALHSTGDLSLKADGKVIVEGKKGINIDSDADLTQKALRVDLRAQTSLDLVGTAEAKLISSAITTVQGSLVKIN